MQNKIDSLVEEIHNICMNDSIAINLRPLGDLAAIAAGYPLRGGIEALPHGDVAMIQMGDVSSVKGIVWNKVRRVGLPRVRDSLFLQIGDVIFTTRGLRNFALALDNIPCEAVCSPHLFVMRVKYPDVIMPAFLAWQINQKPIQDYFQREATGSYILNIRREVMETVPIAVPPLHQQQAIIALAKLAVAECAALQSLITNRANELDAIARDLHRGQTQTIKRLNK